MQKTQKQNEPHKDIREHSEMDSKKTLKKKRMNIKKTQTYKVPGKGGVWGGVWVYL